MREINPKSESQKIITFIRSTLKKQGFSRLVLGLSGGVDSAAAAFLAAKAVGPKNLYVLLLPYQNQSTQLAELVLESLKLPRKNVLCFNLATVWEATRKNLYNRYKSYNYYNKNRLAEANLLPRLRMIFLFDAAKRLNALVCGTENRSEHLLGYFTRFGDEASDIEPLLHLYKTQVYQLARYLGVPDQVIKSPPTAGLWPGQTDEKELGFSYEEADPILAGIANFSSRRRALKCANPGLVQKVLKRVRENRFKRETPYSIKS